MRVSVSGPQPSGQSLDESNKGPQSQAVDACSLLAALKTLNGSTTWLDKDDRPFGCFARKVDAWFTWCNHLPGPSISPKRTPMKAL